MQQYVAQDTAPDTWLLIGPESTTSVALNVAIVVNYPDSHSDTLPANVPAVIPGGGTTWARDKQVWVVYCNKGEGILRAVPEAQLALLSADFAPLARVLRHRIQPYQPQQPGGTPDVSGAWSG